jgi:hypothetical protein
MSLIISQNSIDKPVTVISSCLMDAVNSLLCLVAGKNDDDRQADRSEDVPEQQSKTLAYHLIKPSIVGQT